MKESAVMNPYSTRYNEEEDLLLISEAFKGASDALNKLVQRHQQFIYNVALKFVRDDDDAADLTQEVLIKMVTKLNQFEGKSSFRTWLYKMVTNHFLNSQKKKREASIVSFDEYGEYLDTVHNEEEMTREEMELKEKEITWTRNKCMSGALLCLDRQQRMVFILGAVFNLKSPVAAEILDMTPENFRKQLSRAKADLFSFMQNKCGLMNPDNPCRCHKKTKGFISEGIVHPETIQFYSEVTDSIEAIAEHKTYEMDHLIEGRYLYLFTNQPYERRRDNEAKSRDILNDPMVKQLFELA